MSKKVHSIGAHTGTLEYFCQTVFAGKFEKVTNVRRPESTQNSLLSEFRLETLSHSITKFSAVKARRETKLNYYIEGIQTDILTRGLVSENLRTEEFEIYYWHFRTL